MTNLLSPYNRSAVPKNMLDLFRWEFFEPRLLRDYIIKHQLEGLDDPAIFFILKAIVSAVFIATILSLISWLFTALLVIGLNLPTFYPEHFQPEIIENWNNLCCFSEKLIWWVQISILDLMIRLSNALIRVHLISVAILIGFFLMHKIAPTVGKFSALFYVLPIYLLFFPYVYILVGIKTGLTGDLAINIANFLALGLTTGNFLIALVVIEGRDVIRDFFKPIIRFGSFPKRVGNGTD